MVPCRIFATLLSDIPDFLIQTSGHLYTLLSYSVAILYSISPLFYISIVFESGFIVRSTDFIQPVASYQPLLVCSQSSDEECLYIHSDIISHYPVPSSYNHSLHIIIFSSTSILCCAVTDQPTPPDSLLRPHRLDSSLSFIFLAPSTSTFLFPSSPLLCIISFILITISTPDYSHPLLYISFPP